MSGLRIEGLQKLTLLDFPEKIACTVFLGGCNLRCPFCHNSSLVLDKKQNQTMSIESLCEFLKSRQGILDGVAVTGGEPLINKDIADLLRPIKALGFAVKLDTNGCFPDRLKSVVEEGLVDYVAMDVKNSYEDYPSTVGIPDFDARNVRVSIEYLLSGVVDYEFRTTVVKEFHNEKNIFELAQSIKGAKRYYLQAFVDSGELISNGLHGYQKEVLLGYQTMLKPFFDTVEVRGL